MRPHRAYDGGDWIYSTCFVQDADFWWHIDEDGDNTMVGTPEPPTGVFDTFGKEAYLNDIVLHKHAKGIIEFNNGKFFVKWRNGPHYFTDLSALRKFVVIGTTTEEKL